MAAKIIRYVEAGIATGAADGTNLADAWPSINAAVAGINSEYASGLVTADVQIDILCYNTANVDDSTAAIVDIVSDDTRFPHFISTGNNQYRHTSPAATSDYTLRGSITNGHVVKFTDFDFSRPYSGTGRHAIGPRKADVYLDKCICVCESPAQSNAAFVEMQFGDGRAIVTNTTIKDFAAADSYGLYSETNASLLSANNVYDNCNTGVLGYAGDKCLNDIYQNCTTDISGADNIDYCLTDNASIAGTGTNNILNTTLTFVDSANADYHLVAGDTAAIGAGLGPASDSDVPVDDVDGDTRSGATTDIGIDLYGGAGGLTLDSTPTDVNNQTQESSVVSTPATAPTTGNTEVKFDDDLGPAATVDSVTGTDPYTLNYTFPRTTAKLFSTTGYPLYHEVDAENVTSSGNVPYLPVTGQDFVDLPSPVNTAGTLGEIYAGSPAGTGDQWVHDTQLTGDATVGLDVDAQGYWILDGAPSVTSTASFYRIDSTGTVDVVDTITFEVSSSNSEGHASYKAWMESLPSGSFTTKLRLFLEGKGYSGSTTTMLFSYLKTISSKSSHQERKKDWEDGGWN